MFMSKINKGPLHLTLKVVEYAVKCYYMVMLVTALYLLYEYKIMSNIALINASRF